MTAILNSAEVTPTPMAPILALADARSRLRSIFDELRGSPAWPWGPDEVRLHREEILPRLYAGLSNESEVQQWQGRIEGEMARLDASSMPF